MYYYPENGFTLVKPYPPHLAHLYAQPTAAALAPPAPPPLPLPANDVIHPYYIPVPAGYICSPPYLPAPLMYPTPAALPAPPATSTKDKAKNGPDDDGWGDDPFDGKYAGSDKTAVEKKKEQSKTKTITVIRHKLKYPNEYGFAVPNKKGFKTIEDAIKWHMDDGLRVEDMEKILVMECKHGGWDVVGAVKKPDED